MNNCQIYLEQISLLADGLLEEDALRTLEAHLAVCPDCAARRDVFMAFREVMPDLAETPPGTLTPSILRRLESRGRDRARSTLRRLIPLSAAAVMALLLIWGGMPSVSDNVLPPMQNESQTAATEAAPEAGLYMDDIADEPLPVPDPDAFAAQQDGAGAGMPPSDATDNSSAATSAPAGVAPTKAAPVETAPAESAPARADTRIYAVVVTLTAEQVPEPLAGYPRTDLGDHAEIVLPRAELDALWPALQADGASMDVSSENTAVPDDVPGGGETGDPYPTTAPLGRADEPPAQEPEWALVVVYYAP